MVQLLFVMSVGSPGLAAVYEGDDDIGSVNFEFGGKVNPSSLPNSLPEPPKALLALEILLLISACMFEEGERVGEMFNSLESLDLDCDDGVIIWVAGSWMKYHFRRFGADGETKVITGCGEPYFQLHLLFTSGADSTVVRKKKVPDYSPPPL